MIFKYDARFSRSTRDGSGRKNHLQCVKDYRDCSRFAAVGVSLQVERSFRNVGNLLRFFWYRVICIMNTIFKACENGDIATLKTFKKSQLECFNERGITPLFLAASRNRQEVVSALLEKGVDVNKRVSRKSFGKATPLHASCVNNNIEISHLLLSVGAAIEAKDTEGKTALASSCIYRNDSIVNLLCSKGANVNAQDRKGNTPLYYAICSKSLACCTILLAAGADPNVENKDGYSPLYRAAESAPVEIITYLLDKGALTQSSNKRDGTTPLMIAAINKRTDVVQLLLERGAILDWRSKCGGFATALFWACEYGNAECAKVLIQAGADCSLVDRHGRNALHSASQKGADGIVEILVERRELFCVDKNGNTPLHLAVNFARLGVVNLLLKAKVDAGIKNKGKQTAYDLAKGFPEVEALFTKT